MRISDWSSDVCSSDLSLLRCRSLHWSVDLDVSGLVAFVNLIDRLNERVGRAVAWLTLLMVMITFAVVVLRYVYSIGWVWLQESYVWLHGIVFMVGAGYTLLHNAHVRVDIFYRPSSVRYKAMVDLFGSLLLLLPVTLVVTYARDRKSTRLNSSH